MYREDEGACRREVREKWQGRWRGEGRKESQSDSSVFGTYHLHTHSVVVCIRRVKRPRNI